MSSSSSQYVRVQLAPKAGFCVKSTTLTPTVLPPPPQAPATTKTSSNEQLEPPPSPIVVPQGRKVFINIAWDPNVPPPPEGTEEDVRRAMEGVENEEEKGWYVPVIVSHAREDLDKAGKPSLLFDCVYNSGVKARTLRDPDFKIFLVELALQRIEAQTRLTLSRAIGTPNIASKGKLLPRTVTLPASLLQPTKAKPTAEPGPSFATVAPKKNDTGSKTTAPLIQEIDGPLHAETPETSKSGKDTDTSLPGLRGILKKSSTAPVEVSVSADVEKDPLAPLEWDWKKDDKGRLRIEIQLAGMSKSLIGASELDVSPRRIELRVPGRPPLDIDVSLSDAEIVSRVSGIYADALEEVQLRAKKARSAREKSNMNDSEEALEEKKRAAGERSLTLKRQRDFDVAGAEAEWKVGDSQVVLYV